MKDQIHLHMSDMRFIDPMSVSFQNHQKGVWSTINAKIKIININVPFFYSIEKTSFVYLLNLID